MAGYSYHAYYKAHVLWKMENSFSAGYSSVELAALGRHINAASRKSDPTDVAFEDND